LNKKHQNTDLPAYYGSIENMDIAIGHLLKKLEQMGEAENTFIVFMSDNGSYRWSSNGVFKAGKTKLWEGGIRVPGIIKWPEYIAPGSQELTPAGVVDILPTIAEIAGATLPDKTIDGVSLVPLFKGEALQRNKPLYWFYSPSRPAVAIRQGDWNMVADPVMDIPTDNMFQEAWIGMVKETELTNFRLYNLRQDPGQQNDLAKQHPDKFKEMKSKLSNLHREVVEEAIDWRTFKF
jgi:arylsulfatase A